MSIELTESQRQVLEGEATPQVIDPKTHAVYVLVPAAVYERVRPILEAEPFDPDDVYGLLADLAPEDWEDVDRYEGTAP